MFGGSSKMRAVRLWLRFSHSTHLSLILHLSPSPTRVTSTRWQPGYREGNKGTWAMTSLILFRSCGTTFIQPGNLHCTAICRSRLKWKGTTVRTQASAYLLDLQTGWRIDTNIATSLIRLSLWSRGKKMASFRSVSGKPWTWRIPVRRLPLYMFAFTSSTISSL